MLTVASFRAVSFNDYPENICMSIFLAGCNLRCPYCHNPWLLDKELSITQEDLLFLHLEKRKIQIPAATISGGEPTINEDLPSFIREIKRLTPQIKLDTNGTNPEILEKLIKEDLLSYIAMDIKGPPSLYGDLFNFKGDESLIRNSIEIIQKSSIPHEFRLTVAEPFTSKETVEEIIQLVDPKELILQPFVNRNSILNPGFAETNKQPSKDYLKELTSVCKENIRVRNYGISRI